MRYIVWFIPVNKKIKFNQFHTFANSIKEAIENLNELNKNNEYKIMGVSGYDNLCLNTFINPADSFINNKFF